MKKVSEFLKWFFYITTCVLFVCAANVLLSGGDVIPASMLWQIMLSGFVTSLVTVVFRPAVWDGGRVFVIKIVIHYFALCAVMILFGCWFGWMSLNIQGIIMMMISVAVVYFLVYFAAYWLDRKQADEINRKLKRKYSEDD